jgi:cytochrome c biogenesis protein CcmG/thiol:disulfide interchange protein DsbE
VSKAASLGAVACAIDRVVDSRLRVPQPFAMQIRPFRAALAAAAVWLAIASPAAAGPIVVGRMAPNFRATTLDGKKLTLADFKGQVLVLNFWATWCGPCRTELPLLNTYEQVQGKFGLHILAVTTEGSAPDSLLRPVAAKLAIPIVSRFSGPYANPAAVPTNYVIDRAGVVRYVNAGAFDLESLNAVLVPLLKEPAPPDLPTAPAVSIAITTR